MARLGVPVGGRVRKLRAVEDQSAPIPEEIASELGRIIRTDKSVERSMRAVKPGLAAPYEE
jgi:hypothetical protein